MNKALLPYNPAAELAETAKLLFPPEKPATPEEIAWVREMRSYLWGPNVAGSHTRVGEFIQIAKEMSDTRRFFFLFQEIWSVCDNTWWWSRWTLFLLRLHHKRRNWLPEGIAALPDLVTVYRGCARHAVRDVSWTLDRGVAERFARGHRLIPVPEPVVASAIIPREHVFAYITDRKESEVVLDPRRLRRLHIEDWHGNSETSP